MIGLLVGVFWLVAPGGAAAAVFTPVFGSPFATGSDPRSVAFSPGGGLLATANAIGDTVSVFSVDRGTGALAQVSGSPFATGSLPESVAFSPGGGPLAIANYLDSTVSVFSVNHTTGALTEVSGSPFATGRQPISVAFSPRGRLVATANDGSDDVSVFSVNQSTGALTQVSGSPFATGSAPDSVAFSPGGGLLATSNGGDSTVSVFSVDQSTGALTQVSGSPFATGSGPDSVAFSPGGGLLATANANDNAVSVFSVGPPSARIGSPAGGGTYNLGQKVATSFSCKDATDAPGIRTCKDSNDSRSPGRLDTTHPGNFIYTVTAVSKDGQRAIRSISYTVVALTVGAVKVSASSARVPLTCPGTGTSGCQATLTLETTDPADTLHVVIVGQASARIPAGQSKTVKITLNDTGKRLLAKRGSLETTLIVAQSTEPVAHKIVTFHPT